MIYLALFLIFPILIFLAIVAVTDKESTKKYKFKVVSAITALGLTFATICGLALNEEATAKKEWRKQTAKIEANCSLIRVQDADGFLGTSKAIYQCESGEISRKISLSKKAELIEKITTGS